MYTRYFGAFFPGGAKRIPVYNVHMYLVCVDAAGDGPGGDDEVHDSLAECRWKLVELDEVLDAVECLAVAARRPVHLLTDGRHVAKDRRVQKRCAHQ